MEKLNNFLKELHTKGYSKQTITTYERIIKRILINKTPEQITQQDIINFLSNIRKTNTVESLPVYESAFRLFFERYLKISNLFNNDIKTRTKHKNKIITVLKEADIKKLLNSVSGRNQLRDKLIIQLCYDAALRVSDIQKIQTKNIHKNGDIKIIAGKGGKDRITKWELKQTWNLFTQYQSQSFYLFQKSNKQTYATCLFERVLRKAGQNSNIDRTTWGVHLLRHSGAVRWSNKGLNIEEIAQRLGHSDINTTALYLRGKLKEL